MALTTRNKPEQFCIQAMISLEKNPVAPRKIQAATNVLDRIIKADNAAGWAELNRVSFPGKPAPNGTDSGPRIYMEYDLPYCDGGSSSATNICDVADAQTTEQKGWLEVNINKVAERHFTITKEQFANFCETPDERTADMLKRKAFEIKREINKECIQELYAVAAACKYADGTATVGNSTKAVTVINQDGNIIPAGLAKITGLYSRADFSGELMTFGGETLRNYFDIKMFQGMSMNSVGANKDPFDMMPFIYDNQFDSEFQTLEGGTDSHGVTVPIGALNFQEWYDNTGYNRESFEDHIATTMEIDGIKYDYNMAYDKCDKLWKVQLIKKYGFGSIPASAYCGGNGLVWHWLFQCGTWDCNAL
jgi:hypothetical protein